MSIRLEQSPNRPKVTGFPILSHSLENFAKKSVWYKIDKIREKIQAIKVFQGCLAFSRVADLPRPEWQNMCKQAPF